MNGSEYRDFKRNSFIYFAFLKIIYDKKQLHISGQNKL